MRLVGYVDPLKARAWSATSSFVRSLPVGVADFPTRINACWRTQLAPSRAAASRAAGIARSTTRAAAAATMAA